MVTIKQINKNYIMLSFMSFYHYNERVDGIPGIYKDYEKKICYAPISSLPFIQAEFDGEIFYKTPLWKLRGESEPAREKILYYGPEPEVPKLALKPFDYQIEGIKFMIDRINNEGFVLNGDGVGLGKTLQSIATMKWFVENRGVRKILIICKKSIKHQWEEEIRKIADWQRVPIYVTGDTKKKRLKSYDGIAAEKAGILITNYQNFLYDADEINKVNYDLVIVDEAHCLKAAKGKMNNNVAEVIAGKRTILLTGTPVMSRPADVFGIVSMVSPKFFGTYEDFEKRYLVMSPIGIYGRTMIGARHLDELQSKIQKFLIMRSSEDVALELPERQNRVVKCNLDTLQERMMEAISVKKNQLKEDRKVVLQNAALSESEKETEVTLMAQKEQAYNAAIQFVANDPSIFRYATPRKYSLSYQLKKMVPESYKMSAKTEATLDLVDEIVSAGEKAIIFCHWASSARMLKDRIEKRTDTEVVMYTGSENAEARERNIKAFKTDPEVGILIGTEAMAEGLNLQVCQFLINYEQADTYAIREQRIGRIRRIGSKYSTINIIDVITDTAESKDIAKLRKLSRDRDLSSALLEQAV